MLNNKTIIVGVTGCIAAYKTCTLVSHLKDLGAEVWVVMTPEAQKLISPLTFRTLSKNPVICDLFSDELKDIPVPHISVTDKADLIVIAPCTANTIGKMAQGIADDALTTMVLASKAKKLIAPAMNDNMWDNPLVQENTKKLKKLGFEFLGPAYGKLACEKEAVGRMVEPEEILSKIQELVGTKQDLKGKSILVTAGGTRESLDPVRFIGNRSSGKMGYALAEAARDRGAEVTLISGPTDLESPQGVKTIKVESAQDMFKAVKKNLDHTSALVMAAAVADYAPENKSKLKIKKSKHETDLKLKATPDILEEIGKAKHHAKLVGFALETDDMIKNAKEKMKKKHLDMIVANGPEAMDADESEVKIILKSGNVESLKKQNKTQTADRILDKLSGILSR